MANKASAYIPVSEAIGWLAENLQVPRADVKKKVYSFCIEEKLAEKSDVRNTRVIVLRSSSMDYSAILKPRDSPHYYEICKSKYFQQKDGRMVEDYKILIKRMAKPEGSCKAARTNGMILAIRG